MNEEHNPPRHPSTVLTKQTVQNMLNYSKVHVLEWQDAGGFPFWLVVSCFSGDWSKPVFHGAFGSHMRAHAFLHADRRVSGLTRSVTTLGRRMLRTQQGEVAYALMLVERMPEG